MVIRERRNRECDSTYAQSSLVPLDLRLLDTVTVSLAVLVVIGVIL